MQKRSLSITDRFSDWILNWIWENRLSFFSTLVFGLIAHMFALTNKLPNHDDVVYLFSKGETITSGRWGLELLRYLIPDYSMPWLHGIVSLLFLSVSVAMIIRLFHIISRLSQIILCGLIIAFPSQIGTFCYMYTSSAYAIAFFLSVLAVREAAQNNWRHWLFSVGLIVLIALIFLGMNIGFAMIVVGFFGYWAVMGLTPALGLFRTVPFVNASSYALVVSPLSVR